MEKEQKDQGLGSEGALHGEQPGAGGAGDGGSGSRLLNAMPAFLMDYFGSKHAAIDGVVPLHGQDGQEEVQQLVGEVRAAEPALPDLCSQLDCRSAMQPYVVPCVLMCRAHGHSIQPMQLPVHDLRSAAAHLQAIALTNKALGIDESEAGVQGDATAGGSSGSGSGRSGGGSVAQTVVDQMRSQGMDAVQMADLDEYTTTCNRKQCGMSARGC